MKSTLLATASIAGLLALPLAALASAPDMGMVQLNIGQGWTNDNFPGGGPFDDPISYGARTQWLFPLSQPVELQADLFAEGMNNIVHGGEGFGERDSALYGGTAHVIHPMEHARVGVAGSIYTVDSWTPFVGKHGHDSVRYGLVALEGQYFTDHWTLFGQGGWFGDINGCVGFEGPEGCVHNGVFVRAKPTYFFSSNMAVSVDGQLFWGDDEFLGTVQGGSVRAEGEYKFTDSPFSGFVGVKYEATTVDVFAAHASENTTTVDIGVRMLLDQKSIFDFSQTGPSMDTPTFHHELASEGILQLDAAERGL